MHARHVAPPTRTSGIAATWLALSLALTMAAGAVGCGDDAGGDTADGGDAGTGGGTSGSGGDGSSEHDAAGPPTPGDGGDVDDAGPEQDGGSSSSRDDAGDDAGRDGGGDDDTADAGPDADTPDAPFSLEAIDDVVLQAGSLETISLELDRDTGFTDLVSIELDDLPASVTATPNPLVLTGTSSGSIELSAPANAAAIGPITITATASAGDDEVSRSFELTVDATEDFQIELDDDMFTVVGGEDYDLTVTVTRGGSFTGAVEVTVEDLPTGVTVNPLTIGSAQTEGVLTFSAPADVATQYQTVTVVGTSGVIEREQEIGVGSQTAPDFSIDYAPNPLTVTSASSGALTVTVDRDTSYNGPITVTFSDLPAGVSATPNPLTIALAEDVGVVTISASGGAVLGSYAITATSEITWRQKVHSPMITVAPAAQFSLDLSPDPLLVAQGSSEDLSVDVTRDGGHTAALTLSSSPEPTGVTDGGGAIATSGTQGTITYSAAANARVIVPTEVMVVASDGTSARSAPLTVIATPAVPNDLDADFGREGLVVDRFGTYNAFNTVQLSGTDILVAGNFGRVHRYAADGTLDSSFGTAGTLVPAAVHWRSSAVDAMGRFVLCGADGEDLVAARLLSSGAIDESFGTDGVARVDLGGTAEVNQCITLADGSVLLAGGVDAVGGNDVVVLKLDGDGDPASGFGASGVWRQDLGGTDIAYAIAPQGTSLLVGGSMSVGGPNQAVVLRLSSSGALEPSFDGDGIRVLSSGNYALGVALLGNGDIGVAGSGGGDYFVARLEGSDGAYDSTFGTAGTATFEPGTAASDSVGVIRFAPDGSFYAAASVDDEFGVMRRLASGAPATVLGGDGIATTVLGDPYHGAADVVIDGSGRYVVVGTSEGRYGVIARYE